MVPVPPQVVAPPPCVRYGYTAVMRTLLGLENGRLSTFTGLVVASAAFTVVSRLELEDALVGGVLLALSAVVSKPITSTL